MKFKNGLLLSAILFFTLTSLADEGMWLPYFLSQVNIERMQKLGYDLTADDIYNINSSSLKDAVIVLDGGSCTGEIVSPEGLFFTNHHCGFAEIQEHSSEEDNILKNGFWARSKDEELPNPGKTVSFLIRVEDVTDTINSVLTPGMDEDARLDSIDAISTRLEAAAVDKTPYEAHVKDLYESNKFYLFVLETFRDVRLVAAPPYSVGKFGGDTDNGMWPRHTGDFSVFRIYTDSIGEPADYSKDNIPLKPRHYFPISLGGYENGDFAMVMGYPGTTSRYLTSDGVKYTMNVINNARINVRKAKLDIIGKYMDTSEKAAIGYATKYARSSNYYKFSIGQNRGLERLKVIDEKKETEDQFAKWVSADETRKQKYGDALKLISDSYLHNGNDLAFQYLAEAFLRGPELFLMANHYSGLYQSLKRKGSKDIISMNTVMLRDNAKTFFKDYDAVTDQKLIAALTEIYVKNVSPEYYPDFVKTIQHKYKGDYEKWAASLFKKSFLDNEDQVNKFLKKPGYLKLANDPVFIISKQIFKELNAIRDSNELDVTNRDKGYRLYLAGLMDMEPDKQFYPDANSTMRLTWGEVGDYYPADAVHYNYYTTLKGYIEKEIPGDTEFDVSPRLKELYYANNFGQYVDRDSTMHTCFITNNDITGGNSGSPVLNGKGQLIGIAFDGNWEAMSGDIAYEPVLQKCINVDIRFVLWMIDKYAGATNLIDEMTIVK